MIQYKFKVQGVPSLVPSFSPNRVKISLWDPNENKSYNLQLMSVNQAQKMLDHYKEPAGHQKEQFRRLKDKSDEATAFLWSCTLTRTEAWTFLFCLLSNKRRIASIMLITRSTSGRLGGQFDS